MERAGLVILIPGLDGHRLTQIQSVFAVSNILIIKFSIFSGPFCNRRDSLQKFYHAGFTVEPKLFQFVKNLLELKPDIPSRGRVSIGHYIKFEEIVERVLEGLNKVGLSLE